MQRPKPIRGFKKFVKDKAPAIQKVVREPTAGGVIFRRDSKSKEVEILLIQDAKDRWTIPKGHIEEGETAKKAARREITEETGLNSVRMMDFLGKINFRYRRGVSLVLMTTDIFLVKALGDTDALQPEDWMNGIKWMRASEVLDKIEYEDIHKLILIALNKIRTQNL